MIITIDGPAGSGKSTAARELAAALEIACLDTGATYRAVTLEAMRRGVDLTNEDSLAAVAEGIDLRMAPLPSGVQVVLGGVDVSRDIRSAEVSDKSQYAARFPKVRTVLVRLQQKLGRQLGSFVTEGRDQGSVVFPDADFKFYLDASPEVRARRRFAELQADGEAVTFESVLQGIVDRDGRDRSRAVAPLIKPAGAIEIDTSDKDIAGVVTTLLACVRGRQ